MGGIRGQHYLTRILRQQGEEALRAELNRLLMEHVGRVSRACVAAMCSRPFFWYLLRKLKMNQVPEEMRIRARMKLRLPPLPKESADP